MTGGARQTAFTAGVDEARSIVGESPVLQEQLSVIKEFAEADAPVHIYGETGTGKELVARTLHALSRRASERFIAQNCGALPDTLLQTILFGHRRGAFTGADRDQVGLFEAANGGTLLLDEIGEMSPLVQGALLRVLQDGELTRLGEFVARKVDVRIVSATNKRLQDEVAAGRFRRDLYFRLATLRIELPTLRERGRDIGILASHFLERYNARSRKAVAGFEPEVLRLLMKYEWPGNVRQLQSEVERACILTPAGCLVGPEALSNEVRALGNDAASAAFRESHLWLGNGWTLPQILERVERSLLQDAMVIGKGNKTAAARILGISRQRLSQRLQRWQLLTSPDRQLP